MNLRNADVLRSIITGNAGLSLLCEMQPDFGKLEVRRPGRAKLAQSPVGVEKVAFGENSRRFGDRKRPAESRKSLVGRPSAMKFVSAFRG